jgi:hypothetical protein
MSSEENLSPKQFKFTPIKFHMSVAEHLRKEHGIEPRGGWSRTGIDEKAHKAEHDKAGDRVAGTTPHKHFVPAIQKKVHGENYGKDYL